jgi:polar amino acid transport system substrate-binding protein
MAEEESQGSNTVLILVVAIVAFIACGALAWILFFSGDDETAELVPTLAATAEAIAPPTTEEAPAATEVPAVPPTNTSIPEEDEVWASIVTEGKMVIGLAADYPPFEYYTDNFLLDGFDVALIREIGELLELDVEIKDMAFDGLFGSLRLNNIDVAISAISINQERERIVGFSNIYFVSEDAVLANANSEIDSIPTEEQLAFLRVGVQSGTVYDAWLTTNLVDSGLMPEENLHHYQQANKAVEDLAAGLIELVVLDLEPANIAAEQGAVKIVAQGLNPQRYAMAVPRGAPQLQSELNRALLLLQVSGRLADLVEEYIGIPEEELPPIPTPPPPAPTPPPGPEPECIDDMSFVQDLSYDDQDMTNPPQLLPGQPFQKGWRMRNTGTCSWDRNYTLVPVGGNVPAARMGGTPVFVQGVVEPGQTYDFWANLVAPLSPGVYQEFWTKRNTNTGILFGDRVWILIEVVPNPIPTPVATQTPSPEIVFFADPEQITQGQCSTLNWHTENVQAVYLYPPGQAWQDNGVAGTGQRPICPAQTTTYDLRVVKLNGTVEIRNAAVHVTRVENTPVISRFTVEPNQIFQGECVLLIWRVDGLVDTVTLYRNNVVIWPGAPTNGSVQDCPPNAGQITYSLEARGSGGTTWAQDIVNVSTMPTPTPVPTSPPEATATPIPPTATPQPIAPPPPPVIEYFTVEPPQIPVGQCVQVSWGVGGTVDLVQLFRDNVIVYDNAPFNGLEQDCTLSSTGTYVYSIVASNSSGQEALSSASVVVVVSEPNDPLIGTQWQLISYDPGSGTRPVIEGTIVAAGFLEEHEMAGFGGCNTYSAQYLVDGASIQISNMVSGRKNCPQTAGLMEQEGAYFALLPTASTFQQTDTQLILGNASGQVILTFSAVLPTPF